MTQQGVHLKDYHIFYTTQISCYQSDKFIFGTSWYDTGIQDKQNIFFISTSKYILLSSNHILYNPILAVMNSIIFCKLRMLIWKICEIWHLNLPSSHTHQQMHYLLTWFKVLNLH